MQHMHRNNEGYRRDDVLDSRYVAVCHSKETNFVSEKVEGSKTKEKKHLSVKKKPTLMDLVY